MTRRVWCVLLLVIALVAACDDESTEEGGSGTVSAALENLRTHMNLVELPHLADVEHHGTFIDFGTPARAKYTIGQWRTGWVEDQASGDVTYSLVGETGRLFFQVDNAGPLTLRFRAKSIGSRNMSVFLNGETLELVRLDEGDEFKDYDLSVPAEHVKTGENYLLLRFGGTQRVGGHDVAAAMESIRVVEGAAVPGGEFVAPSFATLVQAVELSETRRKALAVQRPTALSYYVQVPRGAKLGLGVGAEGAAARVKVTVTPEGGEPVELFSGSAGAEWNDQLLSLEPYEGKIVRLELRAEGEGRGRVAWAPLSILTPKAEEAQESRAKNVVVLMVDTLRADKLRPFNPRSRVRTPELDRIAAQGSVFMNAQAPENWTKPSVASVLTGLYPASHGTKTSEARLPDQALMLSEHLKANGFATGSFIANGYVSDRFGFDQGWDSYTNYIRETKSTEAENVFRDAGDWIESNRGERFFAYIQTIDPHVPYDPPADFVRMYDARDYEGQVQPRQTPDLLEKAKRNPPQVTFSASDRQRLEALHDGEISYHDREMGKFIERLKNLGLWEDTIFVLTSDHGEEFNDHGSWGHGHSVYQELLHVPLLFHMPGLVPASKVHETVSTLDIPTTVLAALSVSNMPASEGRDLMGFMRGTPPPGPTVAFSDFLDDRRVITAGRWKLVLRGVNATIFDLESDPGEERELDRHDHPIAMRYCRVMLGQFLGATNRQRWLDADQGTAGPALQTENAEMDDTIRSQLEALGYAH